MPEPRPRIGAVETPRRVGGSVRDGARPRGEPLRPGAHPRTPMSASPSAPRRRPDPRPLRVAFGLTGLATTSALLSAFLAPFAGADAGSQPPVTVSGPGAADTAAGTVRHVTRYVQLAPGQTAPPNTTVQQAPKPQPRTVVVRTRQSGG